MAKKIKHSDLIQKDVFKPTIEQAQLLLDSLFAVEDQIMDLVKTSSDVATLTKSFGNSKDIEKLQTTTKDLAEQEALLLQVRKEQATLQKELEKLRAEEFKTQQQALKLEIQQRKEAERLEKQRKKEAKQIKDNNSAYSKSSKRLNELRKQYKDLRIENGKATKETSDLLKEIRKLDKELKDVDAEVGQFQRSVGDYGKEALGSTKATLGWAAALIGLNGGLDDVKTAANANTEASKDLNSLTAQAGAIFDTYANRTAKAGTAIFDYLGRLFDAEKVSISFTQVLNQVIKAYEGAEEAARKNAKAAKEAANAQFELDRSILPLKEKLEELNGEFEKQSAIAGDGTRSFNEQEEAAIKAQKANEARLRIQRELANQQLQIIQTNLDGAEDDANRLALEVEASEKRIELQALENELIVAKIETEKVLREVSRDRFERELDFAIDAFDAQKTINERRIADEEKTLSERQGILDRTIELADSSFANQIALTEGFLGQQTDLRELVLEEDEQVIRERLRTLTADDVALGRILEIIKERKFVLQDIADLQKEVKDAVEEELNIRLAAIDETDQILRQREIDRLNFEIENSEKASQEKIDLINERTEKEEEVLRNAANTELRNSELTAEQRTAIQEQLINDLANLERQRLDDVKEVNDEITEDDKETAQKRKEAAVALASEIKDAFKDAINDQFDQANDAIDAEIQQRKEAIQFNKELLAAGNTDFANQLAFEQKQLAKAEIEKRQIAKREAAAKRAIQAVDLYFDAFSRRISDPEVDANQAPLLALGDVAKGIAISEVAKALVSATFITGTENVEKSLGSGGAFFNEKLDNYLGVTKSGKMIRFDGQERIMNPEQNKKVGSMSNDDLAQLAFDYQHGQLLQPYQFESQAYLSSLNGLTDNVRLEMKLGHLSNAVNANALMISSAINNKEVSSFDIDGMLNVVEVIKSKGKIERRTHKRF